MTIVILFSTLITINVNNCYGTCIIYIGWFLKKKTPCMIIYKLQLLYLQAFYNHCTCMFHPRLCPPSRPPLPPHHQPPHADLIVCCDADAYDNTKYDYDEDTDERENYLVKISYNLASVNLTVVMMIVIYGRHRCYCIWKQRCFDGGYLMLPMPLIRGWPDEAEISSALIFLSSLSYYSARFTLSI